MNEQSVAVPMVLKRNWVRWGMEPAVTKMKAVFLSRSLIAALIGATVGCLMILLPETRSAPSLPVIAFVPRTTGTNLAEDMRRGAQAAAQISGYRIYWNAPTREDDVDRQVRIAETAIRRGARAVILGPTNPRGITTMLNALQNRKVPVVIVQTESPIPTGSYLTSVTPDQTKFGRLAAERVIQLTGGSGQVAIVGLDRAMPETLTRARSFIAALASHPAIEIVTEAQGSVQTLEAEQSARAVIHAFPALRVIFAVSADATQGAVLALNGAEARHGVALIGCDRDLFLSDEMQRGKIDSLIAVDGYAVGALAMRTALMGTGGRPLPPPQHVEPVLITRENTTVFDVH
jgi:ribose transport system substrate-binding protein